MVSTNYIFHQAASPFSCSPFLCRNPAGQNRSHFPWRYYRGRPRLSIVSSISPENTDDASTNDDSISNDNVWPSEEITPENTLLPQNDPLPDTKLKVVDPITLKQKLLNALKTFTDGGSQRQDLEALIVSLESLKNVPATEAFTEVALAGEWKLLFSSINMRPGGNVRIREIGQVFDIKKRTLTNKALWSCTGADNVQQIRFLLYVTASYSFQSPGRLRVQLKNHTVVAQPQEDGSKNLMPEDLQDLIRQLQKALPIEFFDPSGVIDITYLEPQFRLAKHMGNNVAGVRNVFVKRHNAATGSGQQ